METAMGRPDDLLVLSRDEFLVGDGANEISGFKSITVCIWVDS